MTPAMEGQKIEVAEIRRADLRWPLPERMSERITGASVIRIRRRSKVLLLDLSSAETLLWHLGMSGRVLISGEVSGSFHHQHPMQEPHDHVVFHMANGGRVTFNDPRRFGAMDLAPTEGLTQHKWLARLGPEPLGNEFDSQVLGEALSGRKTPIKAALLDQRCVAGLGNIYVAEALFRARISPRRLAKNVSKPRVEALVPAIRDVLLEAIEAGGSSLRDHRQASGELGYFQHSFRVYDREGDACTADGCGGTIRRIVQSGRSTYYCPSCQR